jgi:hypothetical protein
MSVARRRALKLCGLAICTLPTFHGAALADGTECKYFSQLPDDCVGAELRKYDNLRNYRYEEIDLFARDVIKKVRYVSSYNTTGLNGGDESGDSAPQPLAHSLDPKGIAKRYQALNVMGEPASVLDVRLARRPFRQGQEFWRPQRRVDGRPPSVSGRGAEQIGLEVLSLFARGSNRSQRIQKGIESVPAR